MKMLRRSGFEFLKYWNLVREEEDEVDEDDEDENAVGSHLCKTAGF